MGFSPSICFWIHLGLTRELCSSGPIAASLLSDRSTTTFGEGFDEDARHTALVRSAFAIVPGPVSGTRTVDVEVVRSFQNIDTVQKIIEDFLDHEVILDDSDYRGYDTAGVAQKIVAALDGLS